MNNVGIAETRVPTWQATITMGRNRGYSNKLISIEEITEIITKIQLEITKQLDVKLSAKLTECTIVFSGQNEPSVTIDFIQYPKFQYKETKLKEAVIQFTKQLMNLCCQNRMVVVFQDETIMFEKSIEIDPKIGFIIKH